MATVLISKNDPQNALAAYPLFDATIRAAIDLIDRHVVLRGTVEVEVLVETTGTGRFAGGGDISFAGQRKTTRADASGRWQVELAPLPASFEPRTLTVEATDTVRLTNLLVGEVWLAAGQSNMEFPLSREAHAATALPAATHTSLRLLNLSFAG